MQIILVHNTYQQPGGEDAVMESEAALLRAAGHGVIEYRRSNCEIDSLTPSKRVMLPKHVVWASDAVQGLRKLIEHEKPSVVHFHNTFLMVSPAAYYPCREARVPVVQTLHNFRLLCSNASLFRNGYVCEDCLGKILPWPAIVHTCYRDSLMETAVVSTMLVIHRWLKTWQKRVDLYIALTQFARRKFIEGGLPSEKIVVKPNFVYPDLGVGEHDGRYALFVGRLSPQKGLQTLLQAWRILKGIPLKIVGDGPLMADIQLQIRNYKIETIETLGRRSREDVLALMRRAFILIFPSECYENFPMVIAEAFACGLPVVSSAHGATLEVVDNGRTGVHFIPGKSESLASKVEWAWTHEKEMKEMMGETRREFEEKYTAEENYKMLMDIYDLAIEQAKNGARR
jgi:glycosyltransferase involved in cell wall biosynthesis